MMVLGAMAVMNSGCHEVVFDPIQSGSLESSPESVVPVDEGPEEADNGPSTPHVIALRGSDVDFESLHFYPTFDPHPWDDPDALVLFFSSAVQQCTQPVIPIEIESDGTCKIEPVWQHILMIPPELNTPGLIDLSNRRIGFHQFMAMAGCAGGGGGGVGSGYWGTLEIVESDETSLFVKVRGTGNTSFPIDGDHTVQRCGS
ncbi:hypothetical protein [Sorangium sp. So ce693]|uniref:hypothetical protein n=1 Tax=Sorangium sp. So ce693 TaxID=3133318 RepID=UPI003F5F1E67